MRNCEERRKSRKENEKSLRDELLNTSVICTFAQILVAGRRDETMLYLFSKFALVHRIRGKFNST